MEMDPIKEQWVINFQNRLGLKLQAGSRPFLSIYRVPLSLVKHHKDAYTPSIMSLGPYHRGMPMDQAKGRVLLRFFSDPTMFLFHRLLEEVKSMEQQLIGYYEIVDNQWVVQPDLFLEMMITDGFFVLAALCFLDSEGSSSFPSDPVVHVHLAFSFRQHWGSYFMAQIKRDMLLLENQLPILLLRTLMIALGGTASYVDKLILSFLDMELQPADDLSQSNDQFGFHILDVYRRRMISGNYPPLGNQSMHWSATELNMAGVQFRKSHIKSFNAIRFSNGTLELPRIDIDDTTETLLLNLMAFERLHADTRADVTCYVHFMRGLISSSRDVTLLRHKHIINLHELSDDDAANLFKKISEGVFVGLDRKEGDSNIGKELSDYLNPWWHIQRAKFARTCFFILEGASPTWVPAFLKTRWAFIVLFVGFFYFATNILQTLYTVLPFYSPNK